MTDVLENLNETSALETPAEPAPRLRLEDRALPLLIAQEPTRVRYLWLGMLCAILILYTIALFGFWAPADGGIDQNAYLVGGKQIAHWRTTRVSPASVYEYVGNMFVVPESQTASGNLALYPKYPFGLPLLYAITIWLTTWKHGVIFAFAISPICAVAAVAGMFYLARAVAGSFAGIRAAILLATSEVMWLLADVANSHASCVACVVWGMFLLLRWWQTGSLGRGILAGFLLAYACTIRYSEGLLVIPIVFVALMRIRWKDWRSYLRNSIPLLAWAVPVIALLLFNHFTIGDWTGYDGSNESEFGRAFTWDKFVETWEQMLRTFHDQGLFFTFPLGVIGLFILAARNWKTTVLMLAWLVPGIALYTSYYWSPERGVAYARFFLTFFPAILVGFAAFARFGILGDDDPDRPRSMRILYPLAVGAVVAIAAGVGTWRSIAGEDDQPGGFGQSLPMQFKSRASLATAGEILRAAVPDGSVLFTEDGRGLNNAINYLEFAGNWQLFGTASFENRGGRNVRMPPGGDPNNPNPMQPHRREVIQQIYAGKSEKNLNDDAKAVVEDALTNQRKVFALTGSPSIATLQRRFLPTNQFSAKIVQRWKDIPDARDENGVPNINPRRRRNGFGQPMPNRPGAQADQRPTEWYLYEIIPAPPPAPKPATKPATHPTSRPVAPK